MLGTALDAGEVDFLEISVNRERQAYVITQMSL